MFAELPKYWGLLRRRLVKPLAAKLGHLLTHSVAASTAHTLIPFHCTDGLLGTGFTVVLLKFGGFSYVKNVRLGRLDLLPKAKSVPAKHNMQ